MTESKETGEMAKFGQQILQTSEKAGQWLDRVFGDGARQLGSAFNDSMAGFRARNRLRVLQKTQKAFEDAGSLGAIRPLSERMIIPIWEAISDECDDTLQDVWASFLKNAIDPSKSNPDRILIDTIRKLEPSDWPILQKLFIMNTGEYCAEDLGIHDTLLEESLYRLTVVGLLTYVDQRAIVTQFDDPAHILTIRANFGKYYETKLLNKLAESTSMGIKKTVNKLKY